MDAVGSRHNRSGKWRPESAASHCARTVVDVFNGVERTHADCVDSDNLMRMMGNGRSLAYYTGLNAPQDLIDRVFTLTRNNMSRLYNEANFLGGWRDRMKYREISAPKTHLLVLSDEDGTLMGFISYRFMMISDCQPPTEVCYIYELQVDELFRSRGVGTFLIGAAMAIARWAGAKKLMCTVLKLNTRALSFYRSKCGFVNDESDPDSYDCRCGHDHCYHILKLELGRPEAPSQGSSAPAGVNNTDFVGHVERVLVRRQLDVRLLEAIGAVQSVDSDALNVVEVRHGLGDLLLVGAGVDDEDEGVDFLDHLHRLLGGQWVLDNRVLVELLRERSAVVAPVLGRSGQGEGASPEEVGVAPDLVALRGGRLLDAVGCDLGLLDLFGLGALLGDCTAMNPAMLATWAGPWAAPAPWSSN
ncbi:GNAT family protein [Babesia ovata]|uniref:N-alpha-acetyltransferase 40 n=1 Tax=Babesia ovata TaxID=189622 RepID=A0A2H6K961_9APIC|nr:GNAT family protein [Babesia ovata]GBE59536.1 GNAT family protein [Babesia ovata]